VVALFDADEYRLLHVADRVIDQHGGEYAFRDQSEGVSRSSRPTSNTVG
jgi:hypothetical protein